MKPLLGPAPVFTTPARTPAGLLRRMRTLLSDPRRWTHHTFARNRGNYPVGVNAAAAISFCLSGAADRCADGTPSQVRCDAMKGSASCLRGDDISAFNDGRTHKEVLAALREAEQVARRRA